MIYLKKPQQWCILLNISSCLYYPYHVNMIFNDIQIKQLLPMINFLTRRQIYPYLIGLKPRLFSIYTYKLHPEIKHTPPSCHVIHFPLSIALICCFNLSGWHIGSFNQLSLSQRITTLSSFICLLLSSLNNLSALICNSNGSVDDD